MSYWKRGRIVSFGLGLASGLVVFVALADQVSARGPEIFPVKSGLVPLVVATFFIAPAIVAGMWSGMRRIAGRFAPLVAIVGVSVAAIGVAAVVHPELL
ncbi:MAG: hypothetical protein ACK5JT_15280 [Hyphomicrobiaceae bacterium]